MMGAFLLAQSNHLDKLWEEFGASFRGDRTTMTTFTTRIAVGVIAVLFLLVLAWLIRAAVRGRNPAVGPASLLRAALHAAGFGLLDRMLLVRVARHAAIDHPVAVLLAPRLFRQRTSAWLTHLPLAGVRDWARARLAVIEQDLFGAPPPQA